MTLDDRARKDHVLTTPDTTTATTDRTAGSGFGMVLVLAGAASAYSVLQSLVVPALGTLQRELDTGTTGAAWIFTTYLLSASVLTPLIGRLGDLFGRRRALVWALVALGAGAVVSALATTLPVMIAGRVVQGAGGAVFPLSFALVRDVVPARHRASGVAWVSATVSVTGALGTVLAGFVLAGLDYHWLFWLPAGLTFLTAAAAHRLIPETGTGSGERRPIGWRGAVLLSLWLTLLLTGISTVPQSGVVSVWFALSMAGAALLAVAWVLVELRAKDPLVDVRILWTPAIRGTNAATLMLGAGMFSGWMVVPLLIQQDPASGVGLGGGPFLVGMVMLLNAAGSLVMTPVVGVLVRRVGGRAPLVLGGLFGALGFVLLSEWHGSVAEVCVGLTVQGCGIGLAFAGIALLTVEAVPAGMTGVATGINTIFRTVGGAIGTTAAGAVLAGSSAAGEPSAPWAYTTVFAGCSAALVLTALVARSVPGGAPRRSPAGEVLSAVPT